MRAFLAAAALLLLASAAPTASASDHVAQFALRSHDAPLDPPGPVEGSGCGLPYPDTNSQPFDTWTVGFCTFTFSGIAPIGGGWTGITSAV